jgi:hypothetical protein
MAETDSTTNTAATEQTGQTEPERTFTQKDVDRIVQERLARHKPEDYDDLKEIADILEDFDFPGTPAEKKARLQEAREARKTAASADSYGEAVKAYDGADDLPPDTVIRSIAKKWGKDPKVVERALQRQVESLEDDDRKQAASKNWAAQVREFEAKNADVDLEKLAKNEKFLKFVKGKQLPLVQLYEDFVDFVGETEAELDTLRKTVAAKDANAKGAQASTGSVKGEAPESEFISLETFEKRRNDREWVKKNADRLAESQRKWQR